MSDQLPARTHLRHAPAISISDSLLAASGGTLTTLFRSISRSSELLLVWGSARPRYLWAPTGPRRERHPERLGHHLLDRLKAGDPAAATPLWAGYFARLVTLARDRLRATTRTAADEEDVALSAFDSFCRGAQAGRFPRLDDRDDLWQVLFLITTRKAGGLVRYQRRQKRGGGRPVLTPASSPTDSTPDGLDTLAGAEPTPDFVAEVSEECARLLDLLGAGDLRSVAVWKMEGYTNEEIAVMLGRSVPTVERKLAAVRTIWREGEDE